MNKRPIKIKSTGKYLPKRIVTGHEVDRVLGLPLGKSQQMSGVAERRYADENETSSKMGALALIDALERSSIRHEELDVIISANGTAEQELPCTASLIQGELKRELNSDNHPVPCFDINATCLSFVTAFDIASSLLATGRFKNIAIVSTEVASIGLNPNQLEAYALFGDGAAAIIVGAPETDETCGVIHANMRTYSEGAEYCKIEGGGSRVHPREFTQYPEKFMFQMDGKKVFKMVSETMSDFFESTLNGAGLLLDEIDLIVPHQASLSGMELVRRKLGIQSAKFMNILANHGNMISVSIPLALHYAIEQGRIQKGQRVMLLGTSAGMSLGSVIFEY